MVFRFFSLKFIYVSWVNLKIYTFTLIAEKETRYKRTQFAQIRVFEVLVRLQLRVRGRDAYILKNRSYLACHDNSFSNTYYQIIYCVCIIVCSIVLWREVCNVMPFDSSKSFIRCLYIASVGSIATARVLNAERKVKTYFFVRTKHFFKYVVAYVCIYLFIYLIPIKTSSVIQPKRQREDKTPHQCRGFY